MKTFNFKLFGGYTVKIDKTDVTVDYAGEKWLFITRAKPRTKTIVFDDILRVEYKESGSLAFGYVRFITKENEAYPSSSYIESSGPPFTTSMPASVNRGKTSRALILGKEEIRFSVPSLFSH